MDVAYASKLAFTVSGSETVRIWESHLCFYLDGRAYKWISNLGNDIIQYNFQIKFTFEAFSSPSMAMYKQLLLTRTQI